MIRALSLPVLNIAFRPLASLHQAYEVAQQRAALAELDAEALADIGVTAEQAMAEAQRPFWDAPANWRG